LLILLDFRLLLLVGQVFIKPAEMATKGGNINSTSINGVKLYTLSGQRSTATLLDPKKKRALRKDKGLLLSLLADSLLSCVF
jgi:hypothetical protein